MNNHLLEYMLFRHLYDSSKLKPGSEPAIDTLHEIRVVHRKLLSSPHPRDIDGLIKTAWALRDRLRQEILVRNTRNRVAREFDRNALQAFVIAGRLVAKRNRDRVAGEVDPALLIQMLANRGAHSLRKAGRR